MSTFNGKAEITHHKGKGARTLPGRGALNDLNAQPSKTINDYSKFGATINQNGPSLTDPEKE